MGYETLFRGLVRNIRDMRASLCAEEFHDRFI